MRVVIILFLIACLGAQLHAGIVGNQSSTAEDSLCIVFQPFDSLGSPVDMASGDSLYLVVFYPGGAVSYRDSISYDDSRITAVDWEDWDGGMAYSLKLSIASIDGAGVEGTYKYCVVVDDASLNLETAVHGEFQLSTEERLSETLVRISDILDSLQSQFAWVAANDICDSINNAITDPNKDNFRSHGDTIQRNASVLTEASNIGVDLSNVINQSAGLYLVNAFVGAIGSLDSISIARTVWNNDIVPPQVRTIGRADTAGVVLSTPSSGSGAYACSLFCMNAADSAAIQGAFVRMLNSSQTATAGIADSDSDGLAVFSLDAAEYHAWPYMTGYMFDPLPVTLSVTAPSTVDTVWAERFDPGDPGSPSLCRVYGWVKDLSGAPVSGATLRAEVETAPLRFGSVVVSPYSKSTVTDSLGYWQLDLIPNSNLVPPGTKYTFTVYYSAGSIATRAVEVPDLSSWQLDW